MKAVIADNLIRVSGISNESQYETVCDYVKRSGCRKRFEDHLTVAIITGSQDALDAFVYLWDND